MSSEAEKSAPSQTIKLLWRQRFAVSRFVSFYQLHLDLTVPVAAHSRIGVITSASAISVSVERTCSRHPVRCEWH